MRTIITHPGQAHRDEFLATGIIRVMVNERFEIVRRDPTDAELNDPEVCVVDVGGRHEPDLWNFDHHQFPRDHVPTCALSLVLKHFDLYKEAVTASPWLRFTEVLDSKGPVVAASIQTLSPFESQILKAWEEDPMSSMVSVVHYQIAEGLIRYWQKFHDELIKIRRTATIVNINDKRVLVLDEVPFVPAVEAYCDEDGYGPIHITVTHDDRGPGWSLYRRNDAVGVDMSRLKDYHSLVTFAHPGGFIAKTVDRSRLSGADLLNLIAKAIYM